jgi:hypothetical protein
MSAVQRPNDSGSAGKVTAKRIRQRVADWQQRIDQLYALISKWLARDPVYHVTTSHLVTLDEELMRANRVAPVELRVLEVRRKDDDELLLSFVPHGLWIIGANGRLDVIGPNQTWILVDQSEPFAKKSDWELYSRRPKAPSVAFESATLRNLIDSST